MTLDLLPPELAARQEVIERLVLDPIRNRILPRPWAPVTDAEWEELAPILWALGCGFAPPGPKRGGRPMTEAAIRARLDAIFRAVTLKHPRGGRGAWRQLPEEFGKPDTASRTCRRWAQRGLWSRLLEEVAHPSATPVFRRLAYWICCAFRRSFTAIGAGRAIALARRLKMFAALPAPSGWLPDRGLSEVFAPLIRETMRRIAEAPGWRPAPGIFPLFNLMTSMIFGRGRIRRAWEPA
jgi:transposase